MRRGGAQQLIAPLVSSTLTTVVVFAPLGLLSGVVGEFFRALSITLSVAVLVSLALPLTVIPCSPGALRLPAPRPARRGRVDRVYPRSHSSSHGPWWRWLDGVALVAVPRLSYGSARVPAQTPTRAASSSTT